MHAYRIVWEQEHKNREIELFAHYTLAGGVVQINQLRPTKVTLYCATTKAAVRELPVHTSAGRKLLASQYESSREGLPSLEEEIFAQHQLRDEVRAASATL